MKRLLGKGILLQRLGPEDLETVRQWRNADHVRYQMDFQQEINPKMQQDWFERIDNDLNWYFLFGENENEWAGIVHIKDIDPVLKTGEAGVFTGEVEFLESPLPVKAVLLMMDFAFEELKLERLEAKMRGDVPSISSFNRRLGYRPMKDGKTNGFIRMEVDQTSFLHATERLRRGLI